MSFCKSYIIILTVCLKMSLCEREHKVHNIVLYPEKHSWCEATAIQQIVGSPGYEPVTINNNVCVGACYSYSIPKTQPAEPGELIGPYCDSCQPSEIKCYHVNLHADEKNVEGPKILQKRVQIIMNCSCMTCDKIRKEDCEISDQNTMELPLNMFRLANSTNLKNAPLEEMPELLEKQNNPNEIKNSASTEISYKLKKKLLSWFNTIEANETTNESSLKDMFDDQKLKDLVQKHKHFESDIDLDQNEENNAKIGADLVDFPLEFGLEGSPSGHKGGHVGMGITPNQIVDDNQKKSPEVSSGELAGHMKHLNHHDHHLGEVQHVGGSSGHLVKGPHGSMTLQLDSDSLTANNDGLVFSYGDHSTNSKKNNDQ